MPNNRNKPNNIFIPIWTLGASVFRLIESSFYTIRELFWNYPEFLFGDNSIRTKMQRIYRVFLPYSHFVSAVILITLIVLPSFTNIHKVLFGATNNYLNEGVIMGTDSSGNIQRLGKVDPLRPSNIQLERDLSELIYEPLLKYEYIEDDSGNFNPQVRNILAERVIKIRQGADYQFNLKKGVLWHKQSESEPDRFLTSDDVIATFNIVSQLEDNNAYIRAIKQLRWERIDDYTLRVCTKSPDENTSCEESESNPIFANFLELISIKIMPEFKLRGVDATEINTKIPDILKSPIGTGKFRFISSSDTQITLQRFDRYHDKELIPNIEFIYFKLFRSFKDGVRALQNGIVHTLSSVSVEYRKEMEGYPQIKVNLSPVLSNQYWGIYFNLRKDPNGNSLGSPAFQDPKVRAAISSAINRDEIIDNALLGVGQEAIGTIPVQSQYYNPDANWYRYNIVRANQLLDEAGWTKKGTNKYRTNANGDELTFSLYFVDNFDRNNVAKTIKNDLESVGVKVIIDRREQPGQDSSENSPSGWTLNEINNQFLLPRTFDAILYGMYTFIDPDRYELFHSSQAQHPGLNISGYSGSVMSVKIRENRQEGESSLISVPRVDRLLEETRALDQDTNAAQRRENYFEIQSLIAQDAPVVFLYNPQFIYYSHTKVKNIDLKNVSSIEDRFRNIEKWEL
jgi:peptide/nickel transport system substrate-binding protein